MAYQIKLTNKEQEELVHRKQNERDGKILRRLLCIDMKHKGMRNLDIAEYCGVCIDTITDWLMLFGSGGFKALCTLQYNGRRISKIEKYKEEIMEKQKAEGIENLKELKSWLAKEHNTKTCISNLFYFCKKNSIFLGKKPE